MVQRDCPGGGSLHIRATKCASPSPSRARFFSVHAVSVQVPHQTLVLDQPGGAVTHPQLALEFKARDVVFRLAHQVHGLKPAHQRQLRGMKDRAGLQRALVVATMALIGLAAVGIHDTVVRACAVLAAVALWPAGLLPQRSSVPYCSRNCVRLSPGWNWIRFMAMVLLLLNLPWG